jgi:HEPN domain-containing protein
MIADLVIANLLRIAREDLDGASVLLPRGNRNAAYLCEQAAEKVIRAILTSEGHHAGIRPGISSTRWSTSSPTRTR